MTTSRPGRDAADVMAQDARSAAFRRRATQLRTRALQALTSALNAARTVDEVTACAESADAALAGPEAGSVYELRGAELHLLRAFGFGPEKLAGWKSVPLAVRTPLTDAARTREFVCVEGRDALAERYGLVTDSQGTWMAAPLLASDRCIGVLGLRYGPNARVDKGLRASVRAAAASLSHALERARHHDRVVEALSVEQRIKSILSHDLRTPLAAMGYGIELLRRDSAHTSLVGRLDNSLRNMRALVDDLVERTLSWQDAQDRQPLRLGSDVIREQTSELMMAFPGARIELTLEPQDGHECRAAVMARVLANLVRNAIQHGTPGSIVRVRYVEDDAHARLYVENLGPAIPAERLEELCSPFVRGRASRGTGLGLFIVAESLRVVDATLTVEHDAGITTFRCDFPRDCWRAR